jgi:hypothetical protein
METFFNVVLILAGVTLLILVINLGGLSGPLLHGHHPEDSRPHPLPPTKEAPGPIPSGIPPNPEKVPPQKVLNTR